MIGLPAYHTAGPKETRVWTIPKGAKAGDGNNQRFFVDVERLTFDWLHWYNNRQRCSTLGSFRRPRPSATTMLKRTAR
jgi:hypothetical protein